MSNFRRAILILLTLGMLAGAAVLVMRQDSPSLTPQEQFQAGLEALEAGDLSALQQAARALDEIPGFEPQTRLLWGAYFLRRNDPQAALKELTAVLPDRALQTRYRLLIGEAFYYQGRLTEAASVFGQVVQEDKDSVSAHRWLAAVYYDLGANDLAIEQLESVLRLDPDDYRPHRLLGLIYFDFQRFEKAIEHYRKALELDPEPKPRIEIVQNLASSLLKTRRYRETLELLAGEEDISGDAFLLAVQSECYRGLGEPQRAAELLRRAESVNPEERRVLMLRAQFAADAGDFDAVLPAMKELLDRDPHDHESRYQLAMAYQRLGRSEESELELQRMKQSQELKQRLTDLSVQAIGEPLNAGVRDELAAVCRKIGRDDQAVLWERAAEACRQAAATQRVAP